MPSLPEPLLPAPPRFRLRSEKNEIIVDGEYVDSTTIKVRTPNYETYGALGVDVKVSISGEGWTVNKIKYNYFANTAARNCIAYGPGLLEKIVFGVEVPFLIQAKDTQVRAWGGGVFCGGWEVQRDLMLQDTPTSGDGGVLI